MDKLNLNQSRTVQKVKIFKLNFVYDKTCVDWI